MGALNLSKEFMTMKYFNNICSWDRYYSHILFNVLLFPLNNRETFIPIPFCLWYHTDHSSETSVSENRSNTLLFKINQVNSVWLFNFFNISVLIYLIFILQYLNKKQLLPRLSNQPSSLHTDTSPAGVTEALSFTSFFIAEITSFPVSKPV